MRIFHGNKYVTLSEWLATDGAALPSGLTALTYSHKVDDNVTVSFSAADLFTARFGGRYIAYPANDDATVPGFASRLTVEAANVYAFMAGVIDGVDRMLTDLYTDGEKETIEYKRAPQGGVNFEDAFSDGGTVRNKTGASSGNIDRVVRAETDLVNMWDKLMAQFEGLFIPVLTPWGCDV